MAETTLAERFEQQAARTPYNIALLFEDRQITYAELNEQANRLAWSLIAAGIGPEDIVALQMERSIEMIEAVLGVLKSGAAYLPLDPDYPAQRIDFLIADAKPKRVLTAPFGNSPASPPPRPPTRTALRRCAPITLPTSSIPPAAQASPRASWSRTPVYRA